VLENVIAGFHVHHSIPAWQYVVHGAVFAEDQRRCREQAARLLDFVGMSARMHVQAGSLSYGEQRMLELARALATKPQLLLIDEPAAGLNARRSTACSTASARCAMVARRSCWSSTTWIS
jgi:ABC-type branched-subunit amino acid transport system ATPase component